ncbi:MAG TPA: histidine kinase, partial [Thermoanaerobaculia bacterium]|nr:histidine kinase [Thermoanaerobaculia bacterium]
LYLLDLERELHEDITLAKISAGVIASRLDHYIAAHQLQNAAIAEERVRVARDLHDSVLQSLTGVAFQLQTLPKLMGRDPDAAQKRFEEIEGVIAHTQKEVRWFIEQLNPENRKTAADTRTISQRLSALAQRFRQQWGIEVDHHVDHVVHLLPMDLRNEVYALVSEGIANAAKHAQASWVSVGIGLDGDHVAIAIADDGKGFPFRGRYDLSELTANKRGPVTLRDRVASLGGQMIIDSSDLGARIDIRVPFRQEGA